MTDKPADKWKALKDAGITSPFYERIESAEDIANCRDWMVRGNYPASMTDCEVCGINGDCGPDCPAMSEECYRSEALGYEYAQSPESAGEKP